MFFRKTIHAVCLHFERYWYMDIFENLLLDNERADFYKWRIIEKDFEITFGQYTIKNVFGCFE